MKKVLLALMVVLVAGCTIGGKEERFVNPVFYNTWENYVRGILKITPTTHYEENIYGYFATVDCEMLENTQERVVLRCLLLPADPSNEKELILTDEPIYWIYEIVAKYDEKYGTYITEYSRREDEKDWTSHTSYVIAK